MCALSLTLSQRGIKLLFACLKHKKNPVAPVATQKGRDGRDPKRGEALNGERKFHTTGRAALVAWRLYHGERLTARQVADDYGIGRAGAYRLLERLCRAIPINKDGKAFVRADLIPTE